MNKIYCTKAGLNEKHLRGQLNNDYRIKVYNDEVFFCLEHDRECLEIEYKTSFDDAETTLYEIVSNGKQIPGTDLDS